MHDKKKPTDLKKVDTKEFELPETVFIRDIDNKVFQSIVLECVNKISGITLVESTFIDSIFGRANTDASFAINAEQDNKNHTVAIKVEVNVQYGIPIPEKAEEIQSKVADEITNITGLHVSSVHVVFKNIVTAEDLKKDPFHTGNPANYSSTPEEYTDEF